MCVPPAGALARRDGNERQRRHHPRLDALATEWGVTAEWLGTNYTSPQKVVSTIADRVRGGIDVLMMLHCNRHETTEPALEIARTAGVPARIVHYAGFTSLQVAPAEPLRRLVENTQTTTRAKAARA